MGIADFPATSEHQHWMRRALELALQASEMGEVPVGAVVVKDGLIIGEGFNQPIRSHDPTAHAEIVALRAAAATLGNYRLPGSSLYVTIEPCSMCTGALIHARIQRLVIGAREPRAGVIVSNDSMLEKDYFNHSIEVVTGVLEADCKDLMQSFFRNRRK